MNAHQSFPITHQFQSNRGIMGMNQPSEQVSPWYALYVTAPRKALRELHEAGFETYAPTYQKLLPAYSWPLRQVNDKHRSAGRPAKLIETPIVDGYIFARIEPRFADALACEHVAYVVASSGVPAAIPEGLLGPIRELELSGRMNEKAPATKARPRGVKRKGLEGLAAWFKTTEEGVQKAARPESWRPIDNEPGRARA